MTVDIAENAMFDHTSKKYLQLCYNFRLLGSRTQYFLHVGSLLSVLG